MASSPQPGARGGRPSPPNCAATAWRLAATGTALADVLDVLLDARLAIRGLGIGTFIDRLTGGLQAHPSVRVELWRGEGGWDNRGRLSTLLRSGAFDIAPRLDPRTAKADVVHFACNIGSVLPGANSVLTVHDLMHRHNRRSQDRLTGFLLEQCLRRAGRVAAVSAQTAADLEAAFPHLAGRVTVIPHGMRRLAPPPGERRHVLAFGGAGDPRKRVPLMIEAYREYRASAASPLPLVVLSRAGLLDDQERDLLAMGARLVPSATPEEVDTLMAGAAALVYPTSEEGFGLPILEAAEAATPVVMDAAARVADEVVGAHCVRVEGERANAWAQALRRAIDGGPVRGALDLPDWETVAARYVELYRAVASGT